MHKILLKNAQIVSETEIKTADILIEGERIAKIGIDIEAIDAELIDATGKHDLRSNDGYIIQGCV